jgi:hypothetical protein
MSAGRLNNCITVGRLAKQITPDPPTPFPEDYITLKFSVGSVINFDPLVVGNWNSFLANEGSEGVTFTDVKLEFFTVKLAGNLDTVTALTIFNKDLLDVEISKLVNLEWLDLANNSLENTEIVVGLANLTHIKLDVNNLWGLNLSTQQVPGDKLISLSLNNNSLINGLDLWNLNKLQYLSITTCDISEITGINSLISLQHLACDNNQISSIYLGECLELLILQCANNPLTELNLSANLELHTLQANNCLLSGTFHIENNLKLKLIVLSNNIDLDNLQGYNLLASIDNLTSFFLNDCKFGLAEIAALFNYIVTADQYPNVLKIDGVGNDYIGGDPAAMADYATIAGNGTIINVNI